MRMVDEAKFNSVPVIGRSFLEEEEDEGAMMFNFSKKEGDSGRESPDFRAMHILDTKEPGYLSSKEEEQFFPTHDLSGAHLYTDGLEED